MTSKRRTRSQRNKTRRASTTYRRARIESLESRRLLAVFQVANTDGVGPGSLREAILDANNTPGADVITFDQSLRGETINVRTPLPGISEQVSIEGPTGPQGTFDGITIDAGGRPFHVLKIVQGAEDVTLSDLTLTGGDVSSVFGAIGTEGYGGGLWNIGLGTTLNRVDLTGNVAQRGGGLYNGGYNFVINDSTITDNIATSDEGDVYGGGIFNYVGNLEIYDSEIADNIAVVRSFTAFGGGIASDAGSVTTHTTTIRDNTSGDAGNVGHGAGIAGVGYAKIYTVTSTVHDNHAFGDGGGIYVDVADTYITASTIADNVAEDRGGGVTVYGQPGLIVPAEFSANHTTITGNVGAEGSGVYLGIANTDGEISNTVIAQNVDPNGIEIDINHQVNVSLLETSWIGTTDGAPGLRPLGDYGGPTLTRVPLPGSRLIDAGSGTSGLEQRGEERIVDGDRDGTAQIDIGAVEFIARAEVSGQVISDLNGNDVHDSGEPGLDGWTMQLFELGQEQPLAETLTASIDLNRDGIIDAESESGLYEFTDIEPGEYEIRQRIEPGFTSNASSLFVTLTDVVVGDLDFFNQRATQTVFGEESYFEVPVPSVSIPIPVQYSTTDGNTLTTGIGVRMHFDSSWLTLESVDNHAPALFQSDQLLADTADYDNDPLTDSFMLISYIDSDALFPDEEILPLSLFDSYFSPTRGNEEGQTTIHFTAATHDARYEFAGEDITISFVSASLDIDQNGRADALTDGLLMNRYLLGATGDSLTEFALAPDATRTDPQEIIDYLDYLRETMLDPNGDGNATTFGDGVILSRYLLGYRDEQLISVSTPASTRTTGDAVADYLEDFHPDALSRVARSAAEGEQISLSRSAALVAGDSNAADSATGETATADSTAGLQSVSLRAIEGPSADSLRVNVRHEANPGDEPLPGLATRLHYDSNVLEYVDANHLAEHHILDQVFEDVEDWDNNPSTDRYLLTGFVDVDGEWDEQETRDTISTVDFLIRNEAYQPTAIKLTSVETPQGWKFEGDESKIALTHTNRASAADVNGDGQVTGLDALIVINRMEREQQELTRLNLSQHFVDVNDDERLSALDALMVINAIEQR